MLVLAGPAPEDFIVQIERGSLMTFIEELELQS